MSATFQNTRAEKIDVLPESSESSRRGLEPEFATIAADQIDLECCLAHIRFATNGATKAFLRRLWAGRR
jgi:hypothetical protein